MPVKQGSLELLEHAAAKELLQSKIPARLAYIGTDGAPRVVPIWFHWDGRDVVLGTPPRASKVAALRKDPRVALTIDSDQWPHDVLFIRGRARVELVDGVVPEYARSAERYFGEDGGKAWTQQASGLFDQWARIAIRPHR